MKLYSLMILKNSVLLRHITRPANEYVKSGFGEVFNE